MFIQELGSNPRFFFSVCITVVVSICIHELAHGVVAVCCGDNTPVESGHMTLNPAAHVSPVSVICLLLAGIAWGSMPVTPRRMRGRYASGLVALAGPVSNVLLAVLAIGSLGVWDRFDARTQAEMPQQLANLRYLLWVFGAVNFHLALFNLIPVPPLDGSHLLANVSQSYAATIQALQATGAFLAGYVLLFTVAGTALAPLAVGAAGRLLHLIRGY